VISILLLFLCSCLSLLFNFRVNCLCAVLGKITCEVIWNQNQNHTTKKWFKIKIKDHSCKRSKSKPKSRV